jgi:hypothetical protein
MDTPPEAMAADWERMTRWERAEAGRSLRRLGWTYSEIMAILPVGKGTLSGWCRDIRLTEAQIEAIKARVPSQKGVPRDTNWKRRLVVQEIRSAATIEVPSLLVNGLWIAGTVLYWGEGFKSEKKVGMANSDPDVLRLFMRWVRAFVDSDAQFVCKLNLHFNNDEPAARRFWAGALGVPESNFYRTFIKPEGTGHRKNHLPWGVCQVNMRRSGDSFHRISAWIDTLRAEWPRQDPR